MKSIFPFICLLVFQYVTALSQCPPNLFDSFNSSGNYEEFWADLRERNYVTTSDSGHVYMAGKFNRDIEIGGDTSRARNGLFILKYDQSGGIIWHQTLFHASFSKVAGIAQDASGNIYLAGSIYRPDTLEGVPLTEAFIAKFAPDSRLLWVMDQGLVNLKSFSMYGDNLYVAGYFNQTVTIGTQNLSPGFNQQEIYIACFSTSGTFQWAQKQAAKTSVREVMLDVDSTGIFLTGETIDASGPGVFATQAYIMKCDTLGSLVWFQSILGAPTNSAGNVIRPSGDGGCYIAAYYDGQARFFGKLVSSKSHYEDVLLLKIGANGDLLWHHSLGTGNVDKPYGMVVDKGGEVFLAAAWDSKFSSSDEVPADVAILRFDPLGNLLDSTRIGGPGSAYPTDMNLGGDGHIWLAGWFVDSLVENGNLHTSPKVNHYFYQVCSDHANVAIDDVVLPLEAEIFPNPTTDGITVNMHLFSTGEIHLTLTDIHGKVLRQKTYQGFPGQKMSSRFSMTDFSTGLYYLHIQQGDRQQHILVVKK